MSIASGSIVQVAWVVTDLDVAEGMFSEQFGIAAWTRLEAIHFAPDTCIYRGQPADFTADVSLAYSGDLQLELIRPVSGDSIYTEFLSAAGPGLHHVCWEVDDIDAAVAAAGRAGLDVLQRGTMAGMMEFAYVDGRAAGAPYLELTRFGPEIRAFFETVKGE